MLFCLHKVSILVDAETPPKIQGWANLFTRTRFFGSTTFASSTGLAIKARQAKQKCACNPAIQKQLEIMLFVFLNLYRTCSFHFLYIFIKRFSNEAFFCLNVVSMSETSCAKKNNFHNSGAYVWMLMNCFCGMVDRRKAFSFISSQHQCQKFSPSRISDRTGAGFEPAKNLGSGLVEWSCAVLITPC